MVMLNELVRQAMKNNADMIGMDDVVEKEVLHHHLLYLLHQEGFLSELTFMGGTALRLCCIHTHTFTHTSELKARDNFAVAEWSWDVWQIPCEPHIDFQFSLLLTLIAWNMRQVNRFSTQEH